MSTYLHSLPWTLALAMAHSGNGVAAPSIPIEASRLVLESGRAVRGFSDESVSLRSDPEATGTSSGSDPRA